MTDPQPNQILSRDDGPVAEVVNRSGSAPVCLVCEHASAAIPESLGALGLADENRYSHAVWDIGAAALARNLSDRLDAPLVLGRVSRLVYDCNRPPERDDAIPAQTEWIAIPGNRDLGGGDRAARASEIYEPFHAVVDETLNGFSTAPVFVTVHSFAPVWYGEARNTELGLLHDRDPALAIAMLAAADPSLINELNRPYSAADGVTHTLAKHATKRGLRNVMIEVRNNLLATDVEISRIATILATMLNTGMAAGADAA